MDLCLESLVNHTICPKCGRYSLKCEERPYPNSSIALEKYLRCQNPKCYEKFDFNLIVKNQMPVSLEIINSDIDTVKEDKMKSLQEELLEMSDKYSGRISELLILAHSKIQKQEKEIYRLKVELNNK